MKKLTHVLICVTFLVMVIPSPISSQAYHSTQNNVTIELIHPRTREVLYTLTSGLEKILITPSGNFLRTVTFTIEKENSIMNFSGPRRILEVKMYYDIDDDGTEEEIYDTMAVLTRSGNLKFVYLYNGAGNRLPRGWDF